MKKILFICPYPAGLAPSQRFRFEQYMRQLGDKGFNTVIKPFFNERTYAACYQSGNLLSKISAIAESYFRRFALLLQAPRFDFVFIHREATPIGPPVIEWFMAKVLRKKIIYDFDDAIWTTDKTDESKLTGMIRWRSKVPSICKWSYRISCGNGYLANFARQSNSNVTINPTTIDNRAILAGQRQAYGSYVTIGWTGSHSTLKYLDGIVPVLQSLQHKHARIRFLVIADRDPGLPLKNFSFVPWKKDNELADLQQIDIGIMPLPDDPWTRGKCGFKALQYMAVSIPALVSPVGVNREIVSHGIEGYWCTSANEWFGCLEDLILNPERRKEMGAKGRQKVIENYSVSANSANFLSLFR